MEDLAGKVAVVTGGAAGIGRGIVEALLDEGARVVIADIEAPVLERTVAELSAAGDVPGRRHRRLGPRLGRGAGRHWSSTSYGACHVLWNNAGVTSGGGGNPWEQEPNDWRWCFGVNVFGTSNGVLAFVPRMIAVGRAGRGGDHLVGRRGHRAGALCLGLRLVQGGHQLLHRGPRPPVHRPEDQAVGRPSSTRRAGCSRPGCGRPSATVPRDLARATAPPAGARAPPSPSSRRPWPPPAVRPTPWTCELGRFAVQGVKEGRFVIGHNLDEAGRLLHARADAIAQGALPPSALEGLG